MRCIGGPFDGRDVPDIESGVRMEIPDWSGKHMAIHHYYRTVGETWQYVGKKTLSPFGRLRWWWRSFASDVPKVQMR